MQGFIKLRDNETLIALANGNYFYFYNMRTEEFFLVRTCHDTIVDIKVNNDYEFVTCSNDGTINIWKY